MVVPVGERLVTLSSHASLILLFSPGPFSHQRRVAYMMPQTHVAHNWVPVGSLCLLQAVFTRVPLPRFASLTRVPLRRQMDSEYNRNDTASSFLAQ